MSRQYGRQPVRGRKAQKPGTPVQPVEIQINLTERQTMEQLALEVQRAFAMVQDYGASGVEKLRFRLLPLGEEGAPIALRDEHGHQVLVIDIPERPATAPYRPNEPGVGVTTSASRPVPVPKTYP